MVTRTRLSVICTLPVLFALYHFTPSWLHSLKDKAMQVTSWDSIWISLVILTIVSLSKLWTNLLRSNPIMTSRNYSSGSSIAHNNLWKSVSDIDVSCCVALRLMIATSSNIMPPGDNPIAVNNNNNNNNNNYYYYYFRIELYLGKLKRSHGTRSGEYVGCCTYGISCLANKFCTSWFERDAALSWWICQSSDVYFSGRLRRTASRRRNRTCT